MGAELRGRIVRNAETYGSLLLPPPLALPPATLAFLAARSATVDIAAAANAPAAGCSVVHRCQVLAVQAVEDAEELAGPPPQHARDVVVLVRGERQRHSRREGRGVPEEQPGELEVLLLLLLLVTSADPAVDRLRGASRPWRKEGSCHGREGEEEEPHFRISGRRPRSDLLGSAVALQLVGLCQK